MLYYLLVSIVQLNIDIYKFWTITQPESHPTLQLASNIQDHYIRLKDARQICCVVIH